MSRSNILSVAAAAVAAFGPMAAQAASTVSGTAEITNFSVKLTDLNRYDFVKPSLKVVPNVTAVTMSERADMGGYAPSQDDRRSYVQGAGSLLDATQLQDQISLNGGSASAGKNGSTVSAKVDASAATYAKVPFGFYREAPQGASIMSNATAFGAWTLSAYTDAVFTGTLRLQANADATTLADNRFASGNVGLNTRSGANGSVTMVASRKGNEVTNVFDDGKRFELYGSISFSDVVVPGGVSAGTSGTPYLERSFTIHVKNASSQSLSLALTADLGVFTTVSPKLLATAPIPEPGTWALMGLGLALTAWRVRATRTGMSA